ncbi:phage capsid protein [Bradyrhizobium sp. 62]|uniref:phage capsid protein n=1 Tax=Bradyrhizobium sp. 62 TaxID=1043588 RepID=UPI0021128C72|nr:phage capsid protein [Bradyrhizobium sp. 62]MCK1367624.1 hypothetical protein [Bradyrhizobium sp. 62]
MSTSVSTAFVQTYQQEVKMLYQRQGSILRPTVRVKDGIVGSTTTFQKIGKGVATVKARAGVITPMNQDHTAIPCTLADFYAGDWVDKLDEAKTNIDERMAIAQGGAWALGRKTDDQIITALGTTTQTASNWTVTSQAAIRNSAINMVQALFANDVPNDGQIFAALSSKAWAFLMTVDEFKRSDYLGTQSNGLPYVEGAPVMRFKNWMGVNWGLHTGVAGAGTATCTLLMWHKQSIGYATGAFAGNIAATDGGSAVSADITWHGDRASYFVNNMMSGGACLIDDTGVIKGTVDDTASLPTS